MRDTGQRVTAVQLGLVWGLCALAPVGVILLAPLLFVGAAAVLLGALLGGVAFAPLRRWRRHGVPSRERGGDPGAEGDHHRFLRSEHGLFDKFRDFLGRLRAAWRETSDAERPI